MAQLNALTGTATDTQEIAGGYGDRVDESGPCSPPIRSSVRRLPRSCVLGTVMLVAIAGCGTDLENVVYQAGAATGRTIVDIGLTQLANALAGVDVPSDTGAPDDNGTPDDSGPVDVDPDDMQDDPNVDDGGGPDATNGDDRPLGDAASGDAVFTSNGCAGCHCADATGGCALSAPNIIDADVTLLDEFLILGSSHPIMFDFTSQELADLEAFLATLGGN